MIGLNKNYILILLLFGLIFCSKKNNNETHLKLKNLISRDLCDSARSYFEQEYPNDIPIELYETRALIYECTGDYYKALNFRFLHCEKFRKDKKSYFRLGMDYFFLKKYSEAKKVFENLYTNSDSDSSKVKYLNNIGMIYLSQNDFNNFKLVSDKQLKLVKNSKSIKKRIIALVYYNRASMYKDLGQKNDYKLYLDTAIFYNPNYKEW